MFPQDADTMPRGLAEPDFGADPAPLPPALSSGPDAWKLLKGLKRRWLLAAGLSLVLGALAAVGAWVFLAPLYTASAQIRIKMTPPWILVPTPETQREFTALQKFQSAQFRNRFVLSEALKQEEMKPILLAHPQPEPILWLQEELKVEFQEGNELMTVSMSGVNPSELTTIVNAVVNAYFKEVIDKEKETRTGRSGELEKIVAESSKALRAKIDALQGLADGLGTSESGAAAQKQVTLLTLLNEKKRQLATVQFDFIKAKSKLDTHLAVDPEKLEPSVEEADILKALDADPAGKQALAKVAKLMDFVQDYQLSAKDPTEPTLVRAKKYLAAAQEQLEARKQEIHKNLRVQKQKQNVIDHQATRQQLEKEVAPLAQLGKDLQEEVKNLEGETDKVGKSSTELERRKAEIIGDEKRLDRYQDELAALQIELRSPPRITKYQDAALQKLETKKQIFGTLAAPVAVTVMVCFAVGWLESRARRITTAEEVVTGLGIRVVGAMPALRHAGAVISDEEEDAQLAGLVESVDAIRTVLLRDARLEKTRMVMVTSAVRGEGKTTLASHLASSLARAGRRTILIDCDLRCPAAHQLFELPPHPGFSEVLMGEVHVAEATMATGVEGLWMIPAGQWDREVIQELAKDTVAKIFERLKREYDFVVLDSHPVLPATDSLLIGQHADAVILSLMREVSQAPRVYTACQKLSTLGIRVLGAVVNGLPEENFGSRPQPMQVAA